MTTPSSRLPGRHLTIPFAIPAYWTPEQAQAVLELLDDLRERIAAYYQLQLFDLYQKQLGAGGFDPPNPKDDNPAF